jgi:hypothetical protein
MSETLTEYATLASFMEMGIITEQEALARWGRFEDRYLTEVTTKAGGKPEEKTLNGARKELAGYKGRLEDCAAELRAKKGKTDDDLMVEDVRAGRRNVDEILLTLEMHQQDDLRFLIGEGTPTADEVQCIKDRNAPLVKRLMAADAEFKAGASRFVQRDRAARMDGAAAPGERIAKVK